MGLRWGCQQATLAMCGLIYQPLILGFATEQTQQDLISEYHLCIVQFVNLVMCSPFSSIS